MKNTTIIILLLFINSLYSQKENKTIFGFKGGLNKTYTVSDSGDFFTNVELYGGFFSDTELTSKLNIQNELLFSYTLDYHFIEFPILLKYKFNNKWSVFFGPKLDFIADNDDDFFEEVFYKFKNFGVSATIGTQYNISKRFFGELRYGHGFTEQVDVIFLDLFNSKRKTVRFGIGFKF